MDFYGKLENIRNGPIDCIENINPIISKYQTRNVYSFVKRTTTSKLTLQQIRQYFSKRSFDEFYSIISLLSRKGRHLVDKISQSDLDLVSNLDIPSFCKSLDASARFRFEPIDFKLNIVSNKIESSIRCAIITPLKIIYTTDSIANSKRVLRAFDQDKFLKISIREENQRAKFLNDSTRNNDKTYDYFRNTMLSGISIGTRRCFFLAMTTSQLKIHNAWFISPYKIDNIVIGTDYIKSWLGDFHNIKNIGKYAVRIGQALSSTIDSYEFTNFIEVKDIERNSYCFTDGVGLITPIHALAISKKIGLSYVPSAFQIRFAGYKGVLSVQPLLEDRESFKLWENNNPIENRLDDNAPLPDIVFRNSMNKFNSSHRILEIITASKSYEFFLNRQVILVLEGLGINPSIFIALQDQYILDILTEVNSDFSTFIRKFASYFSKNIITSDALFFRRLINPILAQIIDDLNKKSKILVKQGRAAMGISDELNILEDNEVFIMFSKESVQSMESLVDYGTYVVPIGTAIIAKNPCNHPGDIRIVKLVDRKELHYLKDVIVFSQRGDRPLFNQCSGSDLDGDIYMISWNKDLIPKATFKS